MQPFLTAHATHPQASLALALAAAQIEAQRAARSTPFEPTLGLIYFSDRYADQAEGLLADLQLRWPGVAWAGSAGIGVIAGGVEYFGDPALVLMLCDVPAAQFSVFNGRKPLQATPGARAFSALVHADPSTPDLAELIAELSARTESSYLFGGVASARSGAARSPHIADGVFDGGLSGIAFSAHVSLISRVTQGSQPVGPTRHITACERNLVLQLDGQPALQVLLDDLSLSLDRPQQALAGLRQTLVGLTDGNASALARGGNFGTDTRVRHIIGIDPGRQAVAIADVAEVGQQLAFCHRDVEAARRDLRRICTEIRDQVEAEADERAVVSASHRAAGAPAAPATTPATTPAASRIAGAIYVSCSGRGGPHFGGPSAEAQIVQHALGDVPLIGFFAAGEIARHHLYGYTGVLTVFVGA